MGQLVALLDDGLVADVDDLVARGVVGSRSEAVRIGLERLVDEDRRRQLGAAIARGYTMRPQTDVEMGWADDLTARMISEEPW